MGFEHNVLKSFCTQNNLRITARTQLHKHLEETPGKNILGPNIID